MAQRQIASSSHPQSRTSPGVTELLASMTLAEKIGQMTQVEKNSITPEAATQYAIGSVLSGGGGNPTPNTVESWAHMVRGFQEAALQSRLAIPLLYGVDAVHGHNNLIGATIFPHNIGLGATRDPALTERVARITALETIATNAQWSFAPCVAVPQDPRWGRTYEGFGERPDLVSSLGQAAVRGLQNADEQNGLAHPHAVLACAKHFVGDGGTAWGTTRRYPWIKNNWQGPGSRYQIDQGETKVSEETLRTVHLAPYQAAIQAGVRSVMVSFSSWGGLKMHAHHYLVTRVLKGELGFSGFCVSDWMAIDQLDQDYTAAVVKSINAGLDMIMVPFDYRRFIDTLTAAVERGDIPLARIDDAVGRILGVKAELGLFDHPYGDESLQPQVGSEAHRQVARQAVRQSLVLLKNERSLPLARDLTRLLVAGRAADDLGLQCGGWTIEWLGQPGTTTPGTTLLAAIKERVSPETTVVFEPHGHFGAGITAEVGLVVLSEAPYAEGEGDRADLTLPPGDVALIERLRPLCRRLIVILYSGRPLIVTEQLPLADAWVAAWLPGTEGQGIADVLFGDVPFSGRLSFTWPRSMDQIPLGASADAPLFPYGHGLTTR